jgi:hypothetical protein
MYISYSTTNTNNNNNSNNNNNEAINKYRLAHIYVHYVHGHCQSRPCTADYALSYLALARTAVQSLEW